MKLFFWLNEMEMNIFDVQLLCFFKNQNIKSYVVGGKALSVLLMKNGIQVEWEHSDVDIYTTLTFMGYWENLKKYIKQIYAQKSLNVIVALNKRDTTDEGYAIKCDCHQIVIIDGKSKRMIRSIDMMSNCSSLKALLSCFDLNICQVGFELVINKPTRDDVEDSFLAFVKCMRKKYKTYFPKEIARLIYEKSFEKDEYVVRIEGLNFVFGDSWNCFAALKMDKAIFTSRKIPSNSSEKFINKIIHRMETRKRKYEERGFSIDEESITQAIIKTQAKKKAKVTTRHFGLY